MDVFGCLGCDIYNIISRSCRYSISSPPRLSASSTTDETPKSISDSAVGNTVRHRLSVVGWFCIPGLQYRQDTVCRFAARTPLKQSCKFKRYRATQKLTAKRRPWKTKLLQPTA